MIEVFEQSDVSTSAADFQADGTAAPGTTGRLADAGHIHPSSSVGYEIVSVDLVSSFYDGAAYRVPTPTSVSAPAGYKVVGGGFKPAAPISSNIVAITSYPTSDGSEWNVTNLTGWGAYGSSTTVIGTLYAVCLAIALY